MVFQAVEWAHYSHMSTLAEVKCTSSRSTKEYSRGCPHTHLIRGSSTSLKTHLTKMETLLAQWPASIRTTR